MPIFHASSVPKISLATLAAAALSLAWLVTANVEPPQLTCTGFAASHCGSGAACHYGVGVGVARARCR